jgi:hypothetical protein
VSATDDRYSGDDDCEKDEYHDLVFRYV